MVMIMVIIIITIMIIIIIIINISLSLSLLSLLSLLSFITTRECMKSSHDIFMTNLHFLPSFDNLHGLYVEIL